MYNDKVKGMMAFGMNGVMIGPDTNKNINALKKADWLVVGEIYPDETSEFWRAPGITADEQKNIKTTVYRLPCAGFAEKDGSMTNSARWVTWKYAAVPPPGQARLDQDIVAQIFLRVRDLYKKEGGKFPDPILNLNWAYGDAAHPSLSQVAMELNGKALADLTDPATGQVIKAGQQLPGFAWLKDDGTTMCGNWIYSGCWTGAQPEIQRRGAEIPPAWGFFRIGRGRGRRTGVCSITALPAIRTGSLGTRLASRSGGMKQQGSGSAMTCPTSNLIPIRKTTWGHSS
jgi:formate dehydrogenase major subunit